MYPCGEQRDPRPSFCSDKENPPANFSLIIGNWVQIVGIQIIGFWVVDLQTSSYCKKSKRISLATKINIWSSGYIEIKFQEGSKAVCALCVCVYLCMSSWVSKQPWRITFLYSPGSHCEQCPSREFNLLCKYKCNWYLRGHSKLPSPPLPEHE